MPHASVNGVELFYQTAADGEPVVFVHEYAGDHRSWDPQVSAFARFYRTITYNHRGYPPSSVPDDPEAYSQEFLLEDLRGLLDTLDIQRAHLVGFSMGGSVVLAFAARYPERCRAIVLAGTGSGTTDRERFERDIDATVELLRREGIARFAETYALGPSRLPFRRKDPHGWEIFRAHLAEHSAVGQALTFLGVQRRRPTIYQMEADLRVLAMPMLIIVGDEDEACIEPSVFMKRRIPRSGLLVVPQTGHAVNLEEPALFNSAVLEFFRLAESGRWATREQVTSSLLP
jgi:pimeloyl-ACP methyl ester carboxylesterase